MTGINLAQDMVWVLSFLLLFHTNRESYQEEVSSSVSGPVLYAVYQNNILNQIINKGLI
jgi:hypothetical protein